MLTDWIMVGITAVYVIATIIICVFNGTSAKATQEQVLESQKQFEENIRLDSMPFLQLEPPYIKTSPLFDIPLPLFQDEMASFDSIDLLLKNVGNGTATNIIYSWECKKYGVNESGYPPINAIMNGDSYCLKICFGFDENMEDSFANPLLFQYDDLLGNTYEQRIILNFENKKLIRCENDTPRLLGE